MNMLHEEFDLDTFTKGVTKIFEEFSGKHSARFTLHDSLIREHSISFGGDTYKLHFDVYDRAGEEMVLFKYDMKGATCILGWIYIQGPYFQDMQGWSPLCEELNATGNASAWKAIEKVILDTFKAHADFYVTKFNSKDPRPIANLSEADVYAAMEMVYNQYTTYPEAGPDDVLRFSATCSNVCITLECGNSYKSVDLVICLVAENCIRDVYYFTYHFSTGSIANERGVRPQGFDEGFAKFKLLGSLMN